LGLEDLQKITIFDVVRGFDKHYPIEETISQVFETGQMKRVSEVKVSDKFFQITVIPIEVAKGVPGVGVLLHDQTEEQNLRHKHEEFLAMVVHELRAPLTVIKGMADLMVRKNKEMPQEKKIEMLEQLRTSSIELLEIVNELLSDTKMDLTKFEVDLRMNDINKVLKDAVDGFESMANEKGLELKLFVDKTVPRFKFDEVKITQVLNNLLSNALKFTKKGNVTLRSELEGDMVRVSVEDTGDGVRDDKKDQLFQKFVQLNDSDESVGPGTGLGLVISKGIIDAHGGRIWIEDNEPRGARFVFTMPLE
jgi:signal transduction histidine kinase